MGGGGGTKWRVEWGQSGGRVRGRVCELQWEQSGG